MKLHLLFFSMMKFESLPNELLLDIFDYINDIELVYIFFNLNSRFNNLLISSKKFHLNFQSLTKTKFDIICKQSLPNRTDRIVSLYLSNDDDTPYQIEQFFSHYFHLYQLISLQTLSLYDIRCSNLINKILPQLSQVKYLTYLKLNLRHCNFDEINQFGQTIWNLSQLIYFHMSYSCSLKYYIISNFDFFITSSSLKHIHLTKGRFTLNHLKHLLICTPYLEELTITITLTYEYNSSLYIDESLKTILPLVKKLNIKFQGYLFELQYIFKLMSNLYYLKIETNNLNLDGYDWKQLIEDYLNNLQVFHLLMPFQITVDNNPEEIVNDLIESFRISFWINERNLYFRCHWEPEGQDENYYYSAYLYTLPYNFDRFDYMDPINSKSTCSNPNDYWNYDSVQTLQSVPNENEEDIKHFPICFTKLQHLIIGWKLGNIRKICPILDYLTTLYIQCYDSHIQTHLQSLINHAPQLKTITFYKNNWSYFFLASKSVRRLLLRDGIFYNVQQCAELCTSTLFNQCEILQINIRTRGIILDLIRKMLNLRVLILYCEYDQWKDNEKYLSSKQDELIRWLKRYLPLECLIQREDGEIRLWIR